MSNVYRAPERDPHPDLVKRVRGLSIAMLLLGISIGLSAASWFAAPAVVSTWVGVLGFLVMLFSVLRWPGPLFTSRDLLRPAESSLLWLWIVPLLIAAVVLLLWMLGPIRSG